MDLWFECWDICFDVHNENIVIEYDELSLYENIIDELCMIDVGILRLDLMCFCIICEWFWDNMWKIKEFHGENPLVVI